MDLDDVYVQIGEFGTQQKIYFFSLCLFNLYAPLHLVQIVFTGQEPHFQCFSSCNASSPAGTSFCNTSITNNDISFSNFHSTPEIAYNNSCPGNMKAHCDRIEFADYPDSFPKEWELVCDRAYEAKMVQSMFMAGVGIGAVTLGALADHFGRRRSLAYTLIGIIICGICSSLVPWFLMYLLFRFLTGFFCAGNILASFVLASELVGPSKRGLCGNIFQVFFALGIVIYSALAYFISNWKLLSFVSTALGIPYLFFFILLPESPRWLITHERTREAKQVLRQIADRNGMIFPSDLDISVPLPNAKRNTLLDVFRKKKTAISTVIQLYSWFVNSVVYYGLTLASDKLGTSIYTSTILSGIVEIPAYVVTAVLIDWIGRKITLSLFMIIGGVSCVAIQFWSHSANVTLGLALFGKLSIAASFAIIYIHSAELFPTVIRNSGLGLCSFFARIGGILAPFVSMADSIQPALQFTIYGILSFTAGILNMLLEETLNRTLPETLEDLKGEPTLRNERGRYAPLNNEDLEESDEDNSTTVFEVKNAITM